MSESIFLEHGGRFMPSELARGPWDPQALHGGAPAALLVDAFERHQPAEGMVIARLGFELLKPIPFAPLTVTVRTVRSGRRVQELAGELRADLGAGAGDPICRATALRLAPVPDGLGRLPAGALASRSVAAPQEATPMRFSLEGSEQTSFAATAMEMRWLDDPAALGPAQVWMRLRAPLVAGREASALSRLAATADFGNGVSASLPFADYIFINADLSIHLHRPPRGEWICIEARTLLHEGGTGLAESILHDEDGPVGRSFQSLVVMRR